MVTGHCQTDSGAVGQHILLLDKTLAECPATHNDRPVPILQCTGQNLAGTGAAFIDQDDDGTALENAQSSGAFLPLKIPPLRPDDQLVFFQEQVGKCQCHVHKTATVAAKVQDHSMRTMFHLFP